FSSRRRHTRSVSAFLLNRSSDLEGLTKRSAVGFLLRSLIMFQTFISRHNSNFFSDKLVLTSQETLTFFLTHVFFCVSKNVSVSCAYTQGKREQFSGFNRTLDAINNVFRSEERRVGKECGALRMQAHYKNNEMDGGRHVECSVI